MRHIECVTQAIPHGATGQLKHPEQHRPASFRSVFYMVGSAGWRRRNPRPQAFWRMPFRPRLRAPEAPRSRGVARKPREREEPQGEGKKVTACASGSAAKHRPHKTRARFYACRRFAASGDRRNEAWLRQRGRKPANRKDGHADRGAFELKAPRVFLREQKVERRARERFRFRIAAHSRKIRSLTPFRLHTLHLPPTPCTCPYLTRSQTAFRYSDSGQFSITG